MIVLNQPKVNNGSFAGIKPSVVIMTEVPLGFNPNLIDLKAKNDGKAEETLWDTSSKTIQVFKVNRDMIESPSNKV